VPAQERLGPDEEAGPAGSGERPADRGEQGAVGGLELGAWDLAAEHSELMTQHQNLQVLGGVAAGEQRERLDPAAQREIGEFRQQGESLQQSGRRKAHDTEPHLRADPQLTGHV